MYRDLPDDVRQAARVAYQTFVRNPRHPGLQFKRIGLREPMYSVRITLNYRAIGLLEDDTVIWWWIGSHADYDKLRL
ncbi:MAG: hypothetical protein HC933_12545 [Pleurocapsa sp. SU_196_0]|nr:hypothetical protein [Pleurocapsa sp. SU_196_0]